METGNPIRQKELADVIILYIYIFIFWGSSPQTSSRTLLWVSYPYIYKGSCSQDVTIATLRMKAAAGAGGESPTTESTGITP